MEIRTHKGYEAEFHKLDTVRVELKMDAQPEILCPVCGETYYLDAFSTGRDYKCSDCKLSLEIADGCLVVFGEQSLSDAFYKKIGAHNC